MKILLHTTILALMLMLPVTVTAQGFNCNELTVTSISSSNGIVYVEIANNGSSFITYPYVAAVTDLNGNVVSTGVLNFFGQLGNSTQTYETTLQGSPLMSFFEGTITFVSVSDTCYLSYAGPVAMAWCTDFCVTGIQQNGNTVSVDLYLYGSAFINYPYVAYLIDTNGDTLTAGTLNFFGQFGGTTVTYETTLTGASFPANFTGTVVFVFDNITCSLPVPCTTLGVNDNSYFESIQLFPNPATERLNIRNPLQRNIAVLNLYASNGMLVKKWHPHNAASASFDLSGLAPGAYVTEVIFDDQVPFRKIWQLVK